MAHLWIADAQTEGWSPVPLRADAYELSAAGITPLEAQPTGNGAARQTLLVRGGEAAGEAWVLLADSGTGARVNGRPPTLGACVLRNRDELVIRGDAGPLRYFFSTEQPARIEPLPQGDRPVRCARCKDVIQPDTSAVQCPSCELWHHQVEGERNCWTYRPGCAACGHTTQLDGTYRWTPEAL